ncbi:hypothetical protein XELAEV_18030920mg [Xenopus laevis]|uniref:Uncharacterized protein n=1 Tax=Xenopus laevis TaxID=8355 RepID=A0A974CME2_XENLA|nr:hypothetical protein XELAEV_18030920mg [Xenopus laevis]
MSARSQNKMSFIIKRKYNVTLVAILWKVNVFSEEAVHVFCKTCTQGIYNTCDIFLISSDLLCALNCTFSIYFLSSNHFVHNFLQSCNIIFS